MRRGLWVEGPCGELFLTVNFDMALGTLYPDRYDSGTPARTSISRREQRDAIASRAATELQGFTLLALADDGVFNPEAESEEVLTALFKSRELPAPDIAWAWPPGARLPLILTSAAVAARSREKPTCDGVIVIDSTSARGLIGSLAKLGVIRYGFL